MWSIAAFACYAFTIHTLIPLTTRYSSYGVASKGELTVCPLGGPLQGQTYRLQEGMWFASPFPLCIVGEEGLVVEDEQSSPLFQVGGPVEPHGRIAYMDGITEIQIVRPSKDGEPCLNYMHFPSNCSQTPHYHTESRVILVLNGKAEYWSAAGTMTLSADGGDTASNMLFVHPHEDHFFQTRSEECALITWHPTSDGPKDEDNPMTSATYY